MNSNIQAGRNQMKKSNKIKRKWKNKRRGIKKDDSKFNKENNSRIRNSINTWLKQ